MTKLAEIEAAIALLPEPQVAELARWLEQHRANKGERFDIESWIEQARGAAKPGVTTNGILSATRGED